MKKLRRGQVESADISVTDVPANGSLSCGAPEQKGRDAAAVLYDDNGFWLILSLEQFRPQIAPQYRGQIEDRVFWYTELGKEPDCVSFILGVGELAKR
jgi:hypothetical protein